MEIAQLGETASSTVVNLRRSVVQPAPSQPEPLLSAPANVRATAGGARPAATAPEGKSESPAGDGLFGDWGSGKTFFMRQLRRTVAQLSKEARDTQAMQQELPFYKRIVQIEFNAWHYVEGRNRWLSLKRFCF